MVRRHPTLSQPGLAALRGDALARRAEPASVANESLAPGWTGLPTFAVRLAPGTSASLRARFPTGELKARSPGDWKSHQEFFAQVLGVLSNPARNGARPARVGPAYELPDASSRPPASPRVRLSSGNDRPLLEVKAGELRLADAAVGGADRVEVAPFPMGTGWGPPLALLWKGRALVGLLGGRWEPAFGPAPGPRAPAPRIPPAWSDPVWPPIPPAAGRESFVMPSVHHTARRAALAAQLAGYIRDIVLAAGGIEFAPDDPAASHRWVLSTRAGPLYLSVHEGPIGASPGAVFGLFVDPERYGPFLGAQANGKWNLHLDEPPNVLALTFRRNLEALVLAPADREPEGVLRERAYADWRVRAIDTVPVRWQVYAPRHPFETLDGSFADVDRALDCARRLDRLCRARDTLSYAGLDEVGR